MDAEQVAREFGLGRVRACSAGPVARGKQGVVWRLETSDGVWALKVPFDQSTEEAVAAPTAFHEAAHAAGVPTPAVRRSMDGRVLLTSGAVQVRVYEWVGLLPPDPTLDPEQVGAAVGRLHAVHVPVTGPVDAWYAEPVGAPAWDDLVARLRASGAPFADDLAAARDELVALEEWVAPAGDVQTCHRDLWADNVLPTADGAVCVIDWENSGPAAPAQELGCVLWEFARDDTARARALTDAYLDAGGRAVPTRRTDLSMLVAQLGHITEIGARDWLEPNQRSPRREDSESWVREVLDDLHTRDRLDALLAVVRRAASSGTT